MSFASNVSKFFRVFFGKRSSVPKNVQIEITNRCNFSCEMCPRKDLKVAEEDMPVEMFEQIINKIPSPDTFILTGWGEPLLHSAFDDLLRIVSSKHPKSGIKFTTNGVMLKDKILDTVLKYNVEQVTFSLEKNPLLESEVSVGHKSMSVIADNIQTLLNRRKNQKVVLQTVIYNDNLEDVMSLIDFAAEKSVDGINLSRVEVWQNKSLTRPSEQVEKKLIKDIKKYARMRGVNVFCINDQSLAVHIATHFDKYCLRLDDYLYINVEGKITPCCSLPHFVMGDAVNDDINTIWNSKKFIDFQKSFRKYCDGCDALTHNQFTHSDKNK